MNLGKKWFKSSDYADDVARLIRGKFGDAQITRDIEHRIAKWGKDINLNINSNKGIIVAFIKKWLFSRKR